MVNKLKDFIKHYKVIRYAIGAIILFLLQQLAYAKWHEYATPQNANQYDDVIYYGLAIICLAIWIYIYFDDLRNILYNDLTGRKYHPDHNTYHRSYTSLVKYFKNANPYKMDETKLPEGNWKQTEGVILGKKGKKLIKRDSDGVGNLACFGLPGSHKTTSQIIPTALRFNGSVLCIDIKGDVLHWTRDKRNVKIFNPDDASQSCHFNVFDGIETMTASERCVFLENLAHIIIPDEQGKEDNFFSSSARDLFCGITLFLLNKSPDASFTAVISTILQGNVFQFCTAISKSSCNEAKNYTNSMIGSNEKNVAGCYNCLCKGIRPFLSGDLKELLEPSPDAITPKDLEDGYDIYIEIPQDKFKVYSPITTIIVANFMNFFMKRQDSSSGTELRPVIMLLDEFPQLHFDFDTLSQAMATLRSKKVTLFLAQQSIAQIEGRYGEAHCREIIDTCAYLSIMSAQDPKSREFFQKLIGRENVLKKSTSQNKGTKQSNGESVQEATEFIFEAADFGNLGEDIVIYANGKYIRAQKTNCWE